MKNINKDIKTLEDVKKILDENGLDSWKLGCILEVVKGEADVFQYWNMMTDNTGKIKLGDYFSFVIDYDDLKLRFSCYLDDEKIEDTLYENTFGSRSGIQEFTNDILLPLFAATIGYSKYSHAFGTHDITYDVKVIDGFYDNALADFWKIPEKVKTCESAIDRIISICKDERVGKVVNKLMETFIDGVNTFAEKGETE